jgi:hypothetical protein
MRASGKGQSFNSNKRLRCRLTKCGQLNGLVDRSMTIFKYISCFEVEFVQRKSAAITVFDHLAGPIDIDTIHLAFICSGTL